MYMDFTEKAFSTKVPPVLAGSPILVAVTTNLNSGDTWDIECYKQYKLKGTQLVILAMNVFAFIGFGRPWVELRVSDLPLESIDGLRWRRAGGARGRSKLQTNAENPFTRPEASQRVLLGRSPTWAWRM